MVFLFFFSGTATSEIYTLFLHDALPISGSSRRARCQLRPPSVDTSTVVIRPRPDQARPEISWKPRSEEHTSELQSPCNLVCRLLLEKKKNTRRDAVAMKLTYK